MKENNNPALLIVLLYFFISLIVALPLVSNTYMIGGDATTHTSIIIQAHLALKEHQFPIRVSPEMDKAFRYPIFQFYSPFVYMVSGALNYVIKNAYRVYKIIIYLSLVTGGFFMYRLGRWLTRSTEAGTLTGVLYLFSPYLMINVGQRTDFTESVAQGLLPVALYYSIRLFYYFSVRYFLGATLSSFILLTTHLITFAYFLVFLLILFMIISFSDKKINGLCRTLGAQLYVFLLAAWYLLPILTCRKQLSIATFLPNPYDYNWLTPLATLLSPIAFNPTPLPNKLTDALYPALGLPMVCSIVMVCYALLYDKKFASQHKMLLPLILTFAIAFFTVWSPINFWKFIPHLFVIAQFSYRLLTDVMWLGSLLFAFALIWLFKKLQRQHVVALIFIILLTNSSWLQHKETGTDHKIGYAIAYGKTSENRDYEMKLPQQAQTIAIADTIIEGCTQHKTTKTCTIAVKKNASVISLPQLYYPNLLRVEADNQPIHYFPTLYQDRAMTGITLDAGTHQVNIQFVGSRPGNIISFIAWCLLLIFAVYLRYSTLFKKMRS